MSDCFGLFTVIELRSGVSIGSAFTRTNICPFNSETILVKKGFLFSQVEANSEEFLGFYLFMFANSKQFMHKKMFLTYLTIWAQRLNILLVLLKPG